MYMPQGMIKAKKKQYPTFSMDALHGADLTQWHKVELYTYNTIS